MEGYDNIGLICLAKHWRTNFKSFFGHNMEREWWYALIEYKQINATLIAKPLWTRLDLVKAGEIVNLVNSVCYKKDIRSWAWTSTARWRYPPWVWISTPWGGCPPRAVLYNDVHIITSWRPGEDIHARVWISIPWGGCSLACLIILYSGPQLDSNWV